MAGEWQVLFAGVAAGGVGVRGRSGTAWGLGAGGRLQQPEMVYFLASCPHYSVTVNRA